MSTQLIAKTRKNFSFGWLRFAKKEAQRNWHKDSFAYLECVPQEALRGKNKIGLDVGCGSGSDMLHLGRDSGKIFGIDISDSVNIAMDNIKKNRNLYVMQADLYYLPFKEKAFDFVYSFGVLHHLPDPERGFNIICSKVKSGGFVIIYVYEDFSQRSKLERAMLAIVNSCRAATARMPPVLIYILSIILAPAVFFACSIPAYILKRSKFLAGMGNKMPYRHTTNLEIIVSDLYDRFSPPIEKRYTKADIENWFKKSNFKDVGIINYRGWVAWGRAQ